MIEDVTTMAEGPTDEDVAAWANEQKRRRQAWLNGPSDYEKMQWARRERRRRANLARADGDDWGAPDGGNVMYRASALGWQNAWAAAWCPFTVLNSVLLPGLLPPVPLGGCPVPPGPSRWTEARGRQFVRRRRRIRF